MRNLRHYTRAITRKLYAEKSTPRPYIRIRNCLIYENTDGKCILSCAIPSQPWPLYYSTDRIFSKVQTDCDIHIFADNPCGAKITKVPAGQSCIDRSLLNYIWFGC